jgi:glycine cleavage system aminomethyltransferase T
VLNAPAPLELKPFRATSHGDYFIARTGYTGEDGFEVLLPAGEAELVLARTDRCRASGLVDWAHATACAWRLA